MSNEVTAWSKEMLPFYINLLLVIFMCGFLILSLAASYYSLLNEIDWFQRSGSVIVAIGVYMEYRHIKLFSNSTSRSSVINGQFSSFSFKVLKACYNKIWHMNYALLMFGTIVWGYGDIPFKLFKCI